MRRVAILGCSGSGKSRLATLLGERLGLPVIHLDAHHWRPGWVATPDAEWEALQPSLLAGEAWVVDGNFAGTLRHRLARADTAVFLDFPTRTCFRGILARWWRHRGEVRPDMGRGCPEQMDVSFLRWVWGFRRNVRPGLLPLLAEFAGRGGRVVTLRSRAEVDAFAADLPGR